MKKITKQTVRRSAAALIFAALYLTAKLLARNAAIAETMAGTLSRWIVTALGTVTSVLPFSLFELSFFALILIGIVLTVKIITEFIRKNWRLSLRLISGTLCAVFCVLFVYSVLLLFYTIFVLIAIVFCLRVTSPVRTGGMRGGIQKFDFARHCGIFLAFVAGFALAEYLCFLFFVSKIVYIV